MQRSRNSTWWWHLATTTSGSLLVKFSSSLSEKQSSKLLQWTTGPYNRQATNTIDKHFKKLHRTLINSCVGKRPKDIVKISPVQETLEILLKVDIDIVCNKICFEIRIWTQKCCTKRYKVNEARESELYLHMSVEGDCVHFQTVLNRKVISAWPDYSEYRQSFSF